MGEICAEIGMTVRANNSKKGTSFFFLFHQSHNTFFCSYYYSQSMGPHCGDVIVNTRLTLVFSWELTI